MIKKHFKQFFQVNKGGGGQGERQTENGREKQKGGMRVNSKPSPHDYLTFGKITMKFKVRVL